MTATDWIQLGVGIVLTLSFAAILWYAWEARRAASASVNMAEEMAEARFASVRPIIVFDSLVTKQTYPPIGANAIKSAMLPVPLTFCPQFYNDGTGPALNIECRIEGCGSVYTGGPPVAFLGTDLAEPAHPGMLRRKREKPELEREDQKDERVEVEKLRGVVVARYKDIFGRSHDSYVDFHFDAEKRMWPLQNLRLDQCLVKGDHHDS